MTPELRSIINNIPMLISSLAGGACLSDTLSVATVALLAASRNWEEILRVIGPIEPTR